MMGDARTKTRTMVGSMNWMAPEVYCYSNIIQYSLYLGNWPIASLLYSTVFQILVIVLEIEPTALLKFSDLQVLERPYDERSDCWSMGCIILEMATTCTHDCNEIGSILVQIKHSPQV